MRYFLNVYPAVFVYTAYVFTQAEPEADARPTLPTDQQMSEIGYTIVEPPSLEEYLVGIKNRAMLVALLTWLRYQLSNTLKDDFPALKIEVIKVEYQGVYPAFGLQGDDKLPPDFPERLNDLVERTLSDSSISDFLNFALNNNIDWTTEAQTLLGP
jgi:hypothetical protein